MTSTTIMPTLNPKDNTQFAEQLNDEMKSSVMPVTTFVGLETVFGFFGNLLILYVFFFRYHKCNFKYFVLCLAFVDFTSTVTTMPGEIVTQTFWYVYPDSNVCKIKSFFNVFTVCASAQTLLVIAVDRYRKICRPLAWQIKPRVAMILCFVQLALAFIIALPVAFLWGLQTNYIVFEDKNVTVTNCEKDQEFRSTNYPLAYTVITETIIGAVMMAMFVLYILVCRKVLRAKWKTPRKVQTPNECQDNDRSIHKHEATATNHEDIAIPRTDCEKVNSDDAVLQKYQKRPHSCKCNHNMIVTPCLAKDGMQTAENLLTISPSPTAVQVTEQTQGKKHPKSVRRKTLIMFILTAVFIVTTIMYMTLLNFIAKDVLHKLTDAQKAVYFFFFRLFFINHVINPILYGILDPEFLRIVKNMYQSCTNKRATS